MVESVKEGVLNMRDEGFSWGCGRHFVQSLPSEGELAII